MSKNFISLIICILLFVLVFNLTACATDIGKIQPDYENIVIPNGSASGHAVIIYQDGPTTIIIPTPTNIPIYNEDYTKEEDIIEEEIEESEVVKEEE